MNRSCRSILSLVALVAARPAAVAAGHLEIGVHGGQTVPTYEQSFRYAPRLPVPPFPGLTLRQEGAFGLDATGGLAFGASVSYFFLPVLAVEGRLDTVDVDVTALSPRFDATLDLPEPFADATVALDLEGGSVDLDRLRPVSLNLKARSPGPVRIFVSGGLSLLPELAFVARQPVALGVTGLPGLGETIEIPTVVMRAEAEPEDEDEGRLGANVGAGLELALGPRVGLAGEVRIFRFRKRTLRWRAATAPSSELEAMLVETLEQELPAVEFEPTFYQATIALLVRF